MAVIDKFASWQTRPGDEWKRAPFESCSPNLELLNAHLANEYGGQSLGCHANRDVRSGGSVSSHAYGAAFDWRYENPGPGRAVLLNVIMPWLIANSSELGVQAIHDYAGSRIWRPPGHSSRSVNGDGWKAQPKSGNMGASWAQWIHTETHPDDFGNTTPIADRLAPPTPITEPSEEDEMPQSFMWRHAKYASTKPGLFWVCNGSVCHLDGRLRDALLDAGVRVITSSNDGVYESMLHATNRPDGF